jgi:hypothetical protein
MEKTAMIKMSPLREDEGKEKSDGRCQGVQEGPTEVTSFDLYLLLNISARHVE